MNVQAGQLAQIVHPSLWGRIVEVLHAAPAGDFHLPDGYQHRGCGPGHWVCESLGSPFSAPTSIDRRRRRETKYAVIEDRWLRPLPGLKNDTPAEVVHELPLDVYGEPAL